MDTSTVDKIKRSTFFTRYGAWLFAVVIALASSIGGYSVLKAQVANHNAIIKILQDKVDKNSKRAIESRVENSSLMLFLTNLKGDLNKRLDRLDSKLDRVK